MLTNKQRVWIDKNKDVILFLAELQERGVDVWGFVDLTKELVDLLDYSKEKNIDLVALLNFIVEQQGAESADNGQSEKAA